MTLSGTGAVTIEKVAYAGWPDCYRISNGEVELVAVASIGPRILRYGFAGGQNFMKEFQEQLGKSVESTWQARGGHRVWLAPEDAVLTYAPDNAPVKADVNGDTLTLTGNVEKETGLQKQMIIKLAPSGTGVQLIHRIFNRGNAPREYSCWSPTMMAQGGIGITTFPPRGTHEKFLAPTNPLVMSAYTDLSDPRWKFTKKYLTLRQDPQNNSPQKLGTFNKDTVGAYLLGSEMFIKRSVASDPRKQPDMGCSFETFTNADFLELETMGEMQTVRPGGFAEHVEHWTLHKDVQIPTLTDDDIDRALLPLLK